MNAIDKGAVWVHVRLYAEGKDWLFYSNIVLCILVLGASSKEALRQQSGRRFCVEDAGEYKKSRLVASTLAHRLPWSPPTCHRAPSSPGRQGEQETIKTVAVATETTDSRTFLGDLQLTLDVINQYFQA